MRAAVHAIAASTLAALLTAPVSAAAGPFEITRTSRTIDATLVLERSLASPPTLFNDGPGDWNDGRSLSGSDVIGTGTSAGTLTVSQQSFVGAGRLEFTGSADAFAEALLAEPIQLPPAFIGAFASGRTAYAVDFDVASPLSVNLAVRGSVGLGSFSFELLRDGAVMASEGLPPGTAGGERSFSAVLLLPPGHYALSAAVSAEASATTLLASQVLAQARSSFTLAPVPEPQSWATLLAGLALVMGMCARRTAARPARAPG